jgi:glycosyltransferase involved in cell wall biosynthesis
MSATSSALPLVWFGSLREPSGYADEARSLLLALDGAGYEPTAREFRWSNVDAGIAGRQLEAMERALARPVPTGDYVCVQHVVAAPGQQNTPGATTVVRTMFETDGLPASMKLRLVEADEIWVPSEFNVETFVRGGLPEQRIRVLPETIDFDLFTPETTDPWPLPGARGFTFLTNFDFTDRKGWDILLEAWARAFSPDDDTCLVLKCLSLHGLNAFAIRSRIDSVLRGRATAPVILNTDVLSVPEMPRLYAAADAFVMASRGEGWGRPYMEAMAMRLPTIGSRWSGNVTFMDDANSWLVDGSVVPVSAGAQQHTPLYQGHRWFEPDIDALVEALRAVRAGGANVTAKAVQARGDLLRCYGPEAVADRVAKLTYDLLDRSGARRAHRPLCTWRGDFGSGHSLAVVNDGHLAGLEGAGHAVEIRAASSPAVASDTVGVAGQWPPSFDAPTSGPFVLYQPWEFGRVPAKWVESIRQSVDEVWAPSEYVRSAYIDSGVAPDLVHVVPNGVDLDRFTPLGPASTLATTKGIIFLFVGGTIHRKGIDILLRAYRAAFTAEDDVCLVIKGFGAQGFYRGQTAESLIAEHQADPAAPELLFLDQEIPFTELPAVYRAADVLVQPYRAEGFCLPALEALACGVPVIVTDGGPTDDFTSEACAWRIPAQPVPLPAQALAGDGLTLAGDGYTLEPDVDALTAILREAADPAARRQRAAHARRHAEPFSWAAAAARAAERVTALDGREPIRCVASASVPERRGFLFLTPAVWSERETWAPALRAYLSAFSDTDDVTLVFPGGDERALPLLSAELEDSGVDPGTAPDIALADAGPIGAHSLELAADAVICADGVRPLRARMILPPDPASLRAAAPIAEEAA